MRKEEIIRRLTAITTQVNFMSEHEVEENIIDNHFTMQFDHECWNEKAKIVTTIQMNKISLPDIDKEYLIKI